MFFRRNELNHLLQIKDLSFSSAKNELVFECKKGQTNPKKWLKNHSMYDTEREFVFCFEAGAGKDFEIDPTGGQNRQEVRAAIPRLRDRHVADSPSCRDKFRRLPKWRHKVASTLPKRCFFDGTNSSICCKYRTYNFKVLKTNWFLSAKKPKRTPSGAPRRCRC